MPRYFAYCTLLDTEEMKRFCPHAQPAVVARLTGYRVAFDQYGADQLGGGCNLHQEAGHEIFGLVYDLSDEEFDELDRISGVDRGYYERVPFIVSRGDGGEVLAATYVMPHPGGPFRPTSAYTRPILAGAAALDLPTGYQSELTDIVHAATGD